MKNARKVLLIGGSGTLGSSIINSKVFKNLDYPTKKKLNLLKRQNIKKFLKKKYYLIINCAALARMKECEKNPTEAVKMNIYGTWNLIQEILNYEKKNKNKVKLIHISTDGVYPSTKGNYSEKDILQPYNIYGWTKLYSESIVKNLKNFVIIRTRFFDKNKIKFNTAATDIFTSMIEVEKLVNEIKNISLTNFVGELNVGGKRKSDFNNYKKYKPTIKPCLRKNILKSINLDLAQDASMNLSLFKKLKRGLWKSIH